MGLWSSEPVGSVGENSNVIDSSLAGTVEDAVERANIQFDGFLDDGSPDVERIEALGERLLGGLEVLREHPCSYLIGVGNPASRRSIDERAMTFGRHAFSQVVHSKAVIGRQVHLGQGAVVCAQAVLTTNITAGRHLHVNLGATIGHDCVIGDDVTLAPGVNVSGNVTIGDEVEFGTGAQVLPGRSIGAV